MKDSVENLSSHHLGKGDKLCLDFGDHQVGYVTMKLASVETPAFFRLKFGEIAKEMTEDSADYDGWISHGADTFWRFIIRKIRLSLLMEAVLLTATAMRGAAPRLIF